MAIALRAKKHNSISQDAMRQVIELEAAGATESYIELYTGISRTTLRNVLGRNKRNLAGGVRTNNELSTRQRQKLLFRITT